LSYGCNQKEAQPIRIISCLQDFSNALTASDNGCQRVLVKIIEE